MLRKTTTTVVKPVETTILLPQGIFHSNNASIFHSAGNPISASCFSLVAFFYWKSNMMHFFNDCFGMLMGTRYKTTNWKHAVFRGLFFGFALIFAIFAIPFCAFLRTQWLERKETILIAAFSFLLLVGGCCFMSVFVLLISKNRLFEIIFLRIGNYSWFIYLLHPYFLNIVRNFLAFLPAIPLPYYACINLVVGVGCPMLLAPIVHQIRFLDFLFYPTKYIKLT